MKLIKYIAEKLGILIACILPFRLVKMLCSVGNYIYTGYMSKQFKHFGKSHIMLHAYHLEGLEYISVGDNTIFEPGLQLTARNDRQHNPVIEIGNGCLIRKDAHITAVNHIKIGNNLLTGTNVFISDNSHGDTKYDTLSIPPVDREVISKGEVIIGDNVWIGNNVCVLAGVTIGDGVVIGSNSVVTHDIPPYSIAVGAPAKVKTNQIRQ